jgi:hypothetical protein
MRKKTSAISFLTVFCFLLVTWLPCQAVDDIIYACKNIKTGTPRLVNSPNKCKTKTEYPVTLSGTSQQNQDPIVGHWTFMQFTVDHPEGVMYPTSPKLSVGDLEIRADGTFTGWNIVKTANSATRFTEDYSNTWVRLSTYHYRCTNGAYDIILNKEGTIGMFALSTTTDSNTLGHYEYGHMFKVTVNRDELK